MDLELDPDLEVIPPHDLRWDIDGTGASDGAEPKLRSKSYNPNVDLELDLELTSHELRWDIDMGLELETGWALD